MVRAMSNQGQVNGQRGRKGVIGEDSRQIGQADSNQNTQKQLITGKYPQSGANRSEIRLVLG